MPSRHYEDEENPFWEDSEDDAFAEEEEEELAEGEEPESRKPEKAPLGAAMDYAEGATGFDDLEALLEEGERMAEEGDIAKALEIFTEAVESYPDSPLSHYNLAVSHYMALRETLDESALWEDIVDEEGHYEEAVAGFERTLELDEEFTPTMNNLARLLALRDRFADAIALLERSLAIDPGQEDATEDLEEIRRCHLEEGGESSPV